MSHSKEKRTELKDINSHLTCTLCQGYFIDATTIIECLHTFCRSCIVRHFGKSIFCPVCDLQVDKYRPLEKLCPDPRKQLLVYKMVPRLRQREMMRQENFVKEHKRIDTYQPTLPTDLPDSVTRDRIVDRIHVHSPEQRISLSLEYECGILNGISSGSASDKQMNTHKRYLQCPAAVTMYHLKKFIRLKYELNAQHDVIISYDGEALSENISLMDVAYQFFWEAKAPMRFTYRIVMRQAVKKIQQSDNKLEPIKTRTDTPPPSPIKPTRQVLRATASSSAPATNRRKATHRRQQRQRSAKTAAYTAIGAMDDNASDKDETPPTKRRKSYKSPRWESEDTSPVPFTVYRGTRGGKTPKALSEEVEKRFSQKPHGRRVYSGVVSSSIDDDSLSSDGGSNQISFNVVSTSATEFQSTHADSLHNTNIAKCKFLASRKRAASDVYEFHSNNEDTNEDSNTTLEFDFVCESKDSESETPTEHNDLERHSSLAEANSDSKKDMVEPEECEQKESQPAKALSDASKRDDNSLGCIGEGSHISEDHDVDQQIDIEVMTEQDLEQHIENSIEEVEIDIDGDEEILNDTEEHVQDDADILDGETASTCLIIAEEEEDDDDGVVEEVIAAEESGHELVVVEEPEKVVENYEQLKATDHTLSTNQSKSIEDSSPVSSRTSVESPVEEYEPEVLHEKVFRKKSKKAKHHHHHHHHHKHKHRHSPVLLVSSAEAAPMKLTLKLRPTPSISPGGSSSNRSPQHDSHSKHKKASLNSPRRESPISESKSLDREWSSKSSLIREFPKLTMQSFPSPQHELPDRFAADASEIKPSSQSPSGKAVSYKSDSPKETVPSPSSKSLPSDFPTAVIKRSSCLSPVNPPTSPTLREMKKMDLDAAERKCVAEDVKERLMQMRAVRHKSTLLNSTPTQPDLKSVKTPSSLIISKVEAGEMPPRTQQESKKPALEILMLAPSPPPESESKVAKRQNELTNKDGPSSTTSSVLKQGKAVMKTENKNVSKDYSGALDLSGNRKREDLVDHSSKSSSPATRADLIQKRRSPVTQLASKDGEGKSQKLESNVAQPHDLGLVPNASLIAFRDFMTRNIEADFVKRNYIDSDPSSRLNAKFIAKYTMNGQGPKASTTSSFCPQPLSSSGSVIQRVRPIPALNDLFPQRRVIGMNMDARSSRPGPNQTVRQIPNPSALLQRQQQQQQQQQLQETLKNQQRQLTEEQLKERYQLFQQNQAARAAHTYSRLNNNLSADKLLGNGSRTSSHAGRSVIINNPACHSGVLHSTSVISQASSSTVLKNAVRSRSIEKVAAGLLSVRANGFAVEAHMGH